MDAEDRGRLGRGVFRGSTYRALVQAMRVWRSPLAGVRRYVDSGYGSYPWRTGLRTPTGMVEVTLPHSHDVRTVNEIYCRDDYGRERPRVVVDIGANIGIAATYFLSRRPDSVVHCWEPGPGNLETLRRNVAPFGQRCRVHARAVSETAGSATFMVEPVGRYSALAGYFPEGVPAEAIEVECDAVADVLREVIAEHGRVDLLKIDTEGNEPALVRAIPAEVWDDIGVAYVEVEGHIEVLTGPPPPGWGGA